MCQCTRERAASLARRMEIEGLYATVGTAVLALAFAALTTRSVLREDEGTQRMREIARLIQDGAAAFLRREYQILAVFVAAVAAVLVVFVDYDVLGRFPPAAGGNRPRTS